MKVFNVRYPRHFEIKVSAETAGEAMQIARKYAVDNHDMPDCAGLLDCEEVLEPIAA